MRLRTAVWAALAAGGCGGADLAALETKQQSLEQQVEVLRKNVDEMRTLMQAMGAVPKGPAAADVAAEAPVGNDLARAVPVTVSRTGTPPVLPPPEAPERRDNTACGYRIAVPWLEALSDQGLEMAGVGRASPLELVHDGRPLTPHAGPLAFERNCKGAFRHQPRFVFFSPADDVDNVGGAWTLRLADDLPLPLGNDGEAYWVYPGTTVTFSFDAGWRAEDWGPMQVDLEAHLLYVGTPDAPDQLGTGEARVVLLDLDQTSSDAKVTIHHTPPNPEAPWTLTVSSPADGPFVLVDSLVIGNSEHSLVVTARAAPGDEGAEPAPEQDP